MKTTHERGAAAVEFALIVLPFMLIVCLLVDVAWVFSQQQAVTNAAREAVRHYTVNYRDVGDPYGDAEQRARDVAAEAGVEGAVPVISAICASNVEITVTVTAPMTNLTGMIPAFGGTNVVEGRSAMRCGG